MTLFSKDIGSESWWAEIAQCGTPVIGPEIKGMHPVTFFWRDPQGSEGPSSTRYVWINITGVTDHHQQGQPQSLQRITGTDVWQWQTRLNTGWRGSYSLIPYHGENPFQAGDEQRAIWRDILPDAIGDPLNPGGSWKSGRGNLSSPLHMPHAPPQPYWLAAQQPSPFQQINFQWHSARLGNSRHVWLMATGNRDGKKRPLAILLDGKFWAETMPVGGPLQAMTDAGELPEALYLLIDSIDAQHRSHELPCNADFWLAVQEELLPQLAEKALYDSDPTRTIVAGQSFGGLSSVYAALHWPEYFGCALSQSGSFWWPQRELSQHGCWLPRQIAQGLADQPPLRFFLQAGLREPLILKVNDGLSQQLSAAGHQVAYHHIDGGHDALCWRGGLTEGLRQLWSLPQPPF